jgi:hypothetical protein
VPVALEEPPALDLGEPAKPLELNQLAHPLQFGEVLLDPRVRKLGQDLGSKRLEHRSQLAHR